MGSQGQVLGVMVGRKVITLVAHCVGCNADITYLLDIDGKPHRTELLWRSGTATKSRHKGF